MTADPIGPERRAVQRWAKNAREAIEARDNAIRRMSAAGASLRAVGDAAGLSHTAVAKIIARAT